MTVVWECVPLPGESGWLGVYLLLIIYYRRASQVKRAQLASGLTYF